MYSADPRLRAGARTINQNSDAFNLNSAHVRAAGKKRDKDPPPSRLLVAETLTQRTKRTNLRRALATPRRIRSGFIVRAEAAIEDQRKKSAHC